MLTSTLTSKGQITIPVDLRNTMGLAAGDSVAFTEIAKGQYVMTAATKAVRKLKGLVAARKPVSIDDMNEAIAARGSRQS